MVPSHPLQMSDKFEDCLTGFMQYQKLYYFSLQNSNVNMNSKIVKEGHKNLPIALWYPYIPLFVCHDGNSV